MSISTAEIHLSSLRHNFQEVLRRVGSVLVLPVIKANAYGHGAVPVARALLREGAERFAVACVAEGLELRAAGITTPILVMGGIYSDEIPAALDASLTPVLSSLQMLEQLADVAKDWRIQVPVHLKVDTGMRRLGLSSEEITDILKNKWPNGLRCEGVMSHLACTDEADDTPTMQQLTRFRALLEHLNNMGMRVPTAHIAGSAGILRFSASHFDLVRPGLMLYGYAPNGTDENLRPVLQWKTRVVQVKHVPAGQAVSYGGTFVTTRPTTLAILSVGYADGYSRRLSNRGHVLIGGRRMPVVGRVCMDLTVVDATGNVPGNRKVVPGDEAVLLGSQGSDSITADEMASWLDTISYEVLSQIGRRVERIYLED